ncbi:hypothetical protein PAMA_005491 [Pampus argenteus]
MDLTLRDALGGGRGGVPAGAPAEALLKRDFVATLEKESYDDKVGETVSKSDYRPLVDGKDTKSSESPRAFTALRLEEEGKRSLNVMLIPVGAFVSVEEVRVEVTARHLEQTDV